MCNEEKIADLKGNLQETTSDISSALPKLSTASFQSLEIVGSIGSLQASETACSPKSFPIPTEQVNLENLHSSSHISSWNDQYDQHNESEEQLSTSLNVNASALEGELQSNSKYHGGPFFHPEHFQNLPLLYQGTLGRADVSAKELHTIGQSQVQCITNRESYEHLSALEPVEQTQMTWAVSTDEQSNLPKSTPSSFNATDLPDEVHAQLSKTMPVAFKQAVQKRVAESIFALQSKKLKGASFAETLDEMSGIMSACGVNTTEEEIYMLPKLTEERRSVVQEEMGRSFLEKKPLREKLIKLANNWGVSFVNEDVELCLSLSLEEWFRRILNRLIRYSDQRQDMVKGKPKLLVTSDVGGQIRMLRQKARETLQANELAGQKQKTMEVEAAPKLKSQARKNNKKAKENAMEVIAPRTRETEGMLMKWKIMAEQARLKRESEAGLPSIQKKSELGTSTLVAADSGRPPGINSQAQPQKCITVNDLISVLEMDPHMTKSTLLYQFYNRVHTAPTEITER